MAGRKVGAGVSTIVWDLYLSPCIPSPACSLNRAGCSCSTPPSGLESSQCTQRPVQRLDVQIHVENKMFRPEQGCPQMPPQLPPSTPTRKGCLQIIPKIFFFFRNKRQENTKKRILKGQGGGGSKHTLFLALSGSEEHQGHSGKGNPHCAGEPAWPQHS